MALISEELGFLPQVEESTDFEQDSIHQFILENAHLLDESEPEDPSISSQDQLPQDRELHGAPASVPVAASPEFSAVRDKLLNQAKEKYANSIQFQQKHKQK